MMLDIVWPGAFAPYLVNLKPALSKEAAKHAQGIIQNNTVDGKLIAMPWFGDFGILYYRTDLLTKYGYKGPPTTWAQLGAMRRRSRTASASQPELLRLRLSGQRLRGADLQRPRVDRLERRRQPHRRRQGHDQQPEGDRDPEHAARLGRQDFAARRDDLPGGESGTRSPPATPPSCATGRMPTRDQDTGQGQVRRDRAPADRGRHRSARSVDGSSGFRSTRRSLRLPIELVRYLTSPAVQRFNAIYNSNVPTIPSVAADKAVLKVNP